MKHWWIGLAAGILLAGCAPAGQTEPARPPERFEAVGRLRCQGIESQVALRRDGYDTFSFESPRGLRGLRLTLDHSFVLMEYAGLERRFTRGSLPENAVAELILSALDSAQEKGVGEKGEVPGETFLLVLEPGSGNILKLSIPDHGLELEVQGFRKLEETA